MRAFSYLSTGSSQFDLVINLIFAKRSSDLMLFNRTALYSPRHHHDSVDPSHRIRGRCLRRRSPLRHRKNHSQKGEQTKVENGTKSKSYSSSKHREGKLKENDFITIIC